MSTVRVVIYITYYLITSVLSNTINMWNYVRNDDIVEGFTNWVLCSISLESGCREEHLVRLNYVFYLFAACFIDIGGVVVFFCFGTSDEVWRFWKEMLGGRFSVVLESTTYTTAIYTATHKSRTVKGDTSSGINQASENEGDNQEAANNTRTLADT